MIQFFEPPPPKQFWKSGSTLDKSMPTLRCVGDTQKDHDDMFALLKAKSSFYNDCEFH